MNRKMSHDEALDYIDAQEINRCHDYMIDWIESEAVRLGRLLTVDEALELL